MTKLAVSYTYKGNAAATAYEADDGRLLTVNSFFFAPSDISATEAQTIAAALTGAVVTKVAGVKIPGALADGCPSDPGAQGRKLTFIRTNGSSMSFVVPKRIGTSLNAIRVALESAINAAGAFPVACVKLEGEYFPSIYDMYVPASKTAVTPTADGNRPPAAAGIQYYYTGLLNYQTDHAPFGSVRLIPFKIASNLAMPAIPTLWSGVIDIAPFSMVASNGLTGCGGSDPREPRHFIVTNAIGATIATATPQNTKIPVSVATPASIAGAALTLATLGSTYCLGYKGETNPRFYRA